MDPWVLSLDVGTTSVKAAAVTLGGDLLGTASAGYPTLRPRPNVVEHDADDWWSAVRQTTASLFAAPGIDRTALRAVGLSGMAATHVLLGHDLRPLAPAMIWQDTRATREAALLNEALGAEGVAAAMGPGLALTASMQAARMRWLHDHLPELLARARVILGSKDVLLHRLTGELATDRTSSSGFCHILTGALHPAMAAATGVGETLLPPRLEPTDIGGRVHAAAADETGIPVGTPVAVGMIDSWCNVLGAAVTRPGDAWDTAGTAEVVGVAAAADSAFGRSTGMHFLTGVALAYGVTQCGTDALTWYAETVPEADRDGRPLTGAAQFAALDALAASAPAGADALVFLPYLQGERSPFSDARARSGFHGLHRGHTRAHLVRSVLEGVAFSVRHVLETHEAAAGVRAERVVVTSGGAKSRLWNQIKADVLDRPFVELHVTDAGSVGAAILGAVALGHASLAEATRSMVRVAATVEPQRAARERYEELYAIYLDLGAALRGLHHRLADLQTKETG
jgi:xylulokinase